MRLFWAVNLPDDLKRKLSGLQSRLRETPANVKWVEQHNLHLTVRFLGEVDAGRVDEITRAAREALAGLSGFSLQLSGLGFFPGPNKPRVVWIGVQGNLVKFRELYNRMETGMAGIGLAGDGKRFSPHLTLGRVRVPQAAAELVSKAGDVACEFGIIGEVKVAAVDLMESRLTRKGPVYTVLNTLCLADRGQV